MPGIFAGAHRETQHSAQHLMAHNGVNVPNASVTCLRFVKTRNADGQGTYCQQLLEPGNVHCLHAGVVAAPK